MRKVDSVNPPELVAQGVRDRVFVAFVVDAKGKVRRPVEDLALKSGRGTLRRQNQQTTA